MYNLEDTICAQSTPSGRGGIHIIRVSGKDSLKIVSKVFKSFPENIQANYVYYGHIYDPQSDNKIDEVLLTYFKQGRSFTNEDTVEISCHGNPLIVKLIIKLLVDWGCRIADRGEFTYRAYKNKRLDLSQAEAVLSLIESNSPAFINKSLKQLEGEFTKELLKIEDQLVWVIARLEAMIDFSSEDIEIESPEILEEKLLKSINDIEPLVSRFTERQILDRGIKTLILGPPNVGKSSFLNLILGKQRSIVSDIEGTTRDFISDQTLIDNKTFEIFDTAGIRDTHDPIESTGISMATSLIDSSDLVIILLDQFNYKEWPRYFHMIKSKKHILAVNKSDLMQEAEKQTVQEYFNEKNQHFHFLSVRKQLGMDDLKLRMSSLFDVEEKNESLEVVSVRQKQSLDSCIDELKNGLRSLNEGLSEEFTLSHLNSALLSLLSLRFIEDEELVRDKIFKDFCLGK